MNVDGLLYSSLGLLQDSPPPLSTLPHLWPCLLRGAAIGLEPTSAQLEAEVVVRLSGVTVHACKHTVHCAAVQSVPVPPFIVSRSGPFVRCTVLLRRVFLWRPSS